MALPLILADATGESAAVYPVLKLQQLTSITVPMSLKENDGTVYVIPDDAVIAFIAVETVYATAIYLTLTGMVTTEDEGLISLTFPAADLTDAGLFLGEITVSVDDAAVKRFKCVVEVEPTYNSQQTEGLVSIAEIRRILKDRAADDNFLLDRVEFTDGEIVEAIMRPVDWWNETAPNGIATYSYCRFPFHDHWRDAVIGDLLQKASYNLFRNALPINSGGINTDNKDRAKAYLELGRSMIREWRSWATSRMQRMNLAGWSGSIKSSYF